jgi:hypothetical protein
MKIRELFQKRVLIPTIPAKYEWQNRQWLDIVLSILAFIGIYLLAWLIAITFD